MKTINLFGLTLLLFCVSVGASTIDVIAAPQEAPDATKLDTLVAEPGVLGVNGRKPPFSHFYLMRQFLLAESDDLTWF